MAALYFTAALALSILHSESYAQLTKDKDTLLNWCLNSTLHKSKPGKEDSLHEQCSPWKDHSCCTEETSKNIHEVDMHNFNINHCSEVKNISENCRRHFVKDNCFYECEPHIGFWVQKTKRRVATERFVNVPLCASDCDTWWSDCKEDYTCAFNWPKNFTFKNGINSCKEDSQCRTFEDVYGDAKTFCENVWDHSWTYTPDDKPCMKMWFDAAGKNPNREVAEHYIDAAFGSAVQCLPITALLGLLFFTYIVIWV